jgi:hypothetical protein
MRGRRILVVLLAMAAARLVCLTGPAHAQPSADQLLTDYGLSAADKQRVLNRDFVTADAPSVSERGLSFAIAFLVKASPEALQGDGGRNRQCRCPGAGLRRNQGPAARPTSRD